MSETAGTVRPRVLIAEDEALIRLDLAEMLVEEGYDVVGEAGDGEVAVRLAEELRPDLCIFDIKMPMMDGLAAAEKIADARIAPVVILTAFSQRELVERARAGRRHGLSGEAIPEERSGSGNRDRAVALRRTRRAGGRGRLADRPFGDAKGRSSGPRAR